MRIRKFLVSGILVAFGSLSLVAEAHATTTIMVTGTSDSGPVTVSDNGSGDNDSAAGVILFNQIVGIWDIAVSTGRTQPAIGTVGDPAMDLSLTAHSTGSGSLTIAFYSDEFGPSLNNVLSASLTGILASNATVTYLTFQDETFSTYQFATPLTSQSYTGAGAFNIGPVTAPLASSSYSLLQVLKLDHVGAGTSINLDGALTAPDGGWTVAMLGSALLAIGLLRRRFGVR